MNQRPDDVGSLPAAAQRAGEEFARLVAVNQTPRIECPWDARQTHLSLVKHLIEETAEVVDAIEVGTADDQREELGDLLMQVVFHASIASDEGEYDIAEVVRGITDKLIARHPYVYGDAEVPDDLDASWERRKKAAKHRDSSLDGIADALPTLARAAKVAQRVHDVGPDMGPAQDEDLSISDREAGEKILSLVRRAQRVGVDADQATRAALRRWEAEIRAAEQS
ncbi:MazG-family transcriptional regulator [Propionibacterium freudenreichii]|uniref:MazG family protein n=1 Tax=Propionibacterium freudenreichii TaxID=1744 RepID=UPI0005A5CCF4|nr:MazG family protein [Propionibacterium freudenreichii]CEI26010.1 MazG-family transcriptional regulator [Propionibacterium freudenreichii]